MSLTSKAPETTEYEVTPAGTHTAICYAIVDIGLQKSTYKGEENIAPKVVLTFELPNELMEDGRPFSISAYVTNSLGKKANLRKYLEGWRGQAFTDEELQGFNLGKVLDKPCTLTVVHSENDGKTYANISGISAVMKGVEIPKRHNDLLTYDMDEPDDIAFEKLPKWLKEKIENAVVVESATPGLEDLPGNDGFDSNIPF